MRLRAPMSLWRVPPWPDNRQPQRPIILLYHSVAKAPTDPWGLRVSPRNFAEHMAILRERAKPLPFAEFDQRFAADDLPPRSVAVTFDDGYADNLHAALPVLEQYRIPATAFISTGYIGADHEYWWDEIDQIFLHRDQLPRVLDLGIGDHMHRWDLGDAGGGLGLLAARRARRWRSWDEHFPTPRHRMVMELGNLLRFTTIESREQALRELRAWAGDGGMRRTHRPMTADELKHFAASPLIEIGAHTVNHASLSSLPPAAQEHEITESKTWLQHALNRSVDSFSYPYGSRNDYSDQTILMLKRTGFQRTCSNFAAPLHPGVDRFQYPRRVALDWPGEEFIGWLSKWFADA